jgi:hypothetical protein|tara:strand:+ start:1313 stop:1516 length:204 start_codon:yes stop_codon:yes gene_type:complete
MLKTKGDTFVELNLQEMNDLLYILSMYSKEEERHWQEEGKPKNHVYHSFKRLRKLFPMDKQVNIVTD